MVAALLRVPTVITAVNAAEVLDQLVRVYQLDPDDVHADLGLLSNTGMDIVTVTVDQGLPQLALVETPQGALCSQLGGLRAGYGVVGSA